jgi:transcriptional regulator with XRE-family HTH domain
MQQQKLRDIRKARGLSPTQLAANAGLSLGTLSRMEAGKPISMESVGKILTYLDLPLEAIKGLNIIPEKEEGEKN